MKKFLGEMRCKKCGYMDVMMPNLKEDGLTFYWNSTDEDVTWTPDNGPICPKCGDGKEE